MEMAYEHEDKQSFEFEETKARHNVSGFFMSLAYAILVLGHFWL